jgi:hypothetical protein
MKNIRLVLVFGLVGLAGDNILLTARAHADDHAQICLNNYNQCLKGCDGATSCNNQCLTNYNGCLGQ